MSKEEYVVNTETAEVTFRGDLCCNFDTKTGELTNVTDLGKKRIRWINEAIKACPSLMEKVDDAVITWGDMEEVRFGRKTIYDYFPNAPQPRENKIGHDHPDVYDWINENHSDFVEVLYPNGKWNAIDAAQKGNKTHAKPGSKGVELHKN